MLYTDPMEQLPPDAMYRFHGKGYRLAMQKDDVMFFTGIGNNTCAIVYPWHATIAAISHMTQVAYYQGYDSHDDSGEIMLLDEDCNYMILSPTITPIKPLRIDQPSVDPDEWEEEDDVK
jgi:hypothetical protein